MVFDYEKKVPYWINRLSFSLRLELQQRVKAAGHELAAEEWALLMVLWRDGPLPMGQLAAVTLRDRTTVTRVVDRLVAKGLLQRMEQEGDRRQVIVQLTQQGVRVRPLLVGAVAPLIEKASRGVTAKEMAITLSVLRRMAGNLEPRDPPSPGKTPRSSK